MYYLYIYILLPYLYLLYCTLLRNDYMYLYLVYVLLVYIHPLSFFVLVCSYTLVIALYRYVLVVYVLCVYQVILYILTLCFTSMFVVCCSRRSSACVRCSFLACFEGLRVLACVLACVRLRSRPLLSIAFAVGYGGGLRVMRSLSSDTPQAHRPSNAYRYTMYRYRCTDTRLWDSILVYRYLVIGCRCL